MKRGSKNLTVRSRWVKYENVYGIKGSSPGDVGSQYAQKHIIIINVRLYKEWSGVPFSTICDKRSVLQYQVG